MSGSAPHAHIPMRPSAPPAPSGGKMKLAVQKFASCDGCQLQLIDMLDEIRLLGDLLENVEVSHFLEAESEIVSGPYDLTLVEGSISTERDLKRIREIRRNSRYLVTIGACATSGGIQALRNWMNFDEVVGLVYASPEYISSLRDSTAIGDHVVVDFELRGCPVNRTQLQEVITSFLAGRRPAVPAHSVCMECKRRGNICVIVARGEACLGPVTQAGCDALCPAFNRGCYGCFGPMEQPNTPAQLDLMARQGESSRQIGRAFRSFAHAVEFDSLSERLLQGGDAAPETEHPQPRPRDDSAGEVN